VAVTGVVLTAWRGAALPLAELRSTPREMPAPRRESAIPASTPPRQGMRGAALYRDVQASVDAPVVLARVDARA